MSLSARRLVAATAATAAVVALSGCNNSDDTAAEKPPASAAASDAASAASTPSATPEDGGATGTSMTGQQFADLLKTALDKATTARVTMDLGGLGSGKGDADYTKTPPELAMTLAMQAMGGTVEIRLVGGTMYLKGSTFGDQWVSIPLDDPSSPLGALGGSLDLTKQLQAFADAVETATDEGTEDVAGESLHHYTTTVDTKKLGESMPGAGSSAGQLPDKTTADWWFDGDGLIRKFSSDIAGTSVTMTLSDWGTDVDIEAPPSDQVITLPGSGTGGA